MRMRDWPELIKAVNTRKNEPLNYLLWINDLAKFGNDGFVGGRTSVLSELTSKSINLSSQHVANSDH